MNRARLLGVTGLVLALAVSAIVMVSPVGKAGVDQTTRLKAKLQKPDITDITFVPYNNWNYVMRNQGSYMYDSPDADGNGNNAGGEFPRGSNVTIVFAGGIYISTIKGTDKVTSQTEFATEFQPGHITNFGVPFDQLTWDDPAASTNQVYLIDESRSGDDWTNWPGDLDAYGDPGLLAAAQTWAVFNDADVTIHREPSVSPNPGIGVEIVLQSFAFSSGAVRDVVFFKFDITNKTSTNYPNTYLGLWMDPDVDNASNDIVGVDTARGLGFCYNADNSDASSCTGFDFFQGPIVDTTQISSKLVNKFRNNKTVLLTYDGNENRYIPETLPGNQIWLGATSFNTYANGTDPRNDGERYNLLAGLYANGNVKAGCGVDDYYAFRGNPVTQSGCDVATSAQQADQRILHGVGPFTLQAGATQVIWAGVIGATGADRISAVDNMLRSDDQAQITFDNGLIAPVAPTPPNIKVLALDGRVMVTWDNRSEFSEDPYGDVVGIKIANGFTTDYVRKDFQGYRVYKSRTGLSGEYTLLAEYDRDDNLTHVRNQFINSRFVLEAEEVRVGSDNGLRYFYEDTDVINGQVYYYSVTGYDAQPYIANTNVPFTDPQFGVVPTPWALPITIESAQGLNVASCVPMQAVAGRRYDAQVSAVAHFGPADGPADVEVIDPTAVTGNSYRIEIELIPDSVNNKPLVIGIPVGTPITRLRNVTTNQLVAFSSKVDDPGTFLDSNNNGVYDTDTASGDRIYDDRFYSIVSDPANPASEEFAIADGLLIKVTDASGMKTADYVNGSFYTGTRWYSGPGGLIYGVGEVEFVEDFWGAGGVPADQRRDVEIRWSRNPSEWSMIYKHGTGSSANINDTCLAPFSAWEVDVTDGDPTPRRINVNFRDRDTYDAWTPDGVNSITGGVGRFNYTYFWAESYDGGTQPFVNVAGHPALVRPAYYVMWLGYRSSDADAAILANRYATAVTAGSPGGTTLTHSERHDIFSNWIDNGTHRFYTNHILTVSDTFAFSTTRNTVLASKSDLKNDLKNAKVVPNPFYGRSLYQSGLFDKRIKFVNLPASCTIRIFTVSGDLVATLVHNGVSNNDRVNTNPLTGQFVASAQETSTETWDARNADGKFVASGMYVAVVDAPEIGKKLLKFAVIQESITINGPDIR